MSSRAAPASAPALCTRPCRPHCDAPGRARPRRPAHRPPAPRAGSSSPAALPPGPFCAAACRWRAAPLAAREAAGRPWPPWRPCAGAVAQCAVWCVRPRSARGTATARAAHALLRPARARRQGVRHTRGSTCEALSTTPAAGATSGAARLTGRG